MLGDYERIQVITQELYGILKREEKILESGQNVNDSSISLGLPKGIHADFLRLVDSVKQIDSKHGFGYSSELDCLRDFGTDRWLEFITKSERLLVIGRQFRVKLQPRPQVRSREGRLSSQQDW